MKDKPRQERRMGRNGMDWNGSEWYGLGGIDVDDTLKIRERGQSQIDWIKSCDIKTSQLFFFFLLTTWSVCCMMHLSGPVLSLFMAAFPYHNCDNNNNNNNNNKNKTIKPVQQLALFWWLMWNVHEKVLALLLPYNMH